MRRLCAQLVYHGLDVRVAIDEDGRHTVEARRGPEDRWSSPVELTPESSEVSS